MTTLPAGWKPISSAPMDGTTVLLFARHVDATASTRVVGSYDNNGFGWIAQCYVGQPFARLVPSHWMELPPFPGTPPASAQPESMREGYPHDDPQFVALCREHDILGTAMQALVAVFWRASAQDDAKDAVMDALAQSLGGTAYFCTRVWEAWHVGTMSSDDFVPIADESDALADMADAVIAVMRPAPAAGDARDSLVNKLAGMAYQYAVTLDQATRDADNDELEAIARRVTGKLKDDIRAVLASQQQEG